MTIFAMIMRYMYVETYHSFDYPELSVMSNVSGWMLPDYHTYLNTHL